MAGMMMLDLGSPVVGLSLLGLAVVLGLVIALDKMRRRSPPWRLPVTIGLADEKGRLPKMPEPKSSALVFPPSRRAALARLLPKSAAASIALSPEELRSKQLPSTRAQDLDKNDQYTPTGISTQEIKALGRFPDYATLSGVRHPEPDPAFDIKTAKFRPFRPFRWNYHQTMALLKYEPDYWVELEENYFKRMHQRLELYRENGEKIMFWSPGSELACRELMEMVVQFICIRYPHYFQLENYNTILRNNLLGTTTEIAGLHPLEVLFRNVPEDYALMCRSDEDGMYYLRAAMICSSVGWNVGEHKDRVLRGIHDNVPLWEEKMAFSVDRWFTKLPVDQPVQRCSWGIEDWEAFYCPSTTPRSAFASNPAACTLDDLHLRCDFQTLRRLPLSGAVVFNFKAVFTKFTDLASEPRVPALVHAVVTRGPRPLVEYKMERHVEAIAAAACGEWARRQVEEGVVPEGWEVETLGEHPYFPGWREKMMVGGEGGGGGGGDEDLPACPMR